MLKRPRPRFLMMSFSVVALLMLILSACGGAATTSTTPSAGTPVKGGTWIDDLFEEPDTLIPNASNETYAAMVMFGLYAPLVYGTPEGVLMPGLAKEVPTVAN